MKRAFGTRRNRVRFASCERSERIMATQLPLHICEANASLTILHPNKKVIDFGGGTFRVFMKKVKKLLTLTLGYGL